MLIYPGLPRKPKGRQDIHLTQVKIVVRLPRKRGGNQRNARAYIGPLGNSHYTTPAIYYSFIRFLGNVHCTKPATEKRRKGTPWQISDPLAVNIE